MKICYQFTTDRPGDYLEVDSSSWEDIAKRDVVDSPYDGDARHGARIDGGGGWIYALHVMGMIYKGFDHYAIQHLSGGRCKLIAWKDDPRSWDAGDFWAREQTFWPLGPDHRLGGGINSKSTSRVFAAPNMLEHWGSRGPIERLTLHPWSDFVPPPENVTRHGIYVSDALANEHVAAYRPRGWRSWTEGVDPKYVDENGLLKPMRPLGLYNKPKGTKTFFQGSNESLNGVYTVSNERAFESSAQASSETEAIGVGSDELAYLFTTAAGAPNEATWPTGDYRCSIDCNNVGGSITYGLRTAGGVTGKFTRVDSGLTSEVDTQAQIEGLFSDAAVNVATTGSVSWSGSTASDRFCCLIAATSVADHGNEQLDLTYDADAFADGPWTAPSGRVMSSLAGAGGLAGQGGIAGKGGGLAA